MKNIINTISGIIIFLGIIMIAGSGNDCDGKCMENANPMWLMLTIMFGALASLGLGAVMLMMAGRH